MRLGFFLYRLALIQFLLFISFSCTKDNRCDCFKSTGKESVIERIPTSFSKIYVEGKVDVYLTEDSVFGIKIEGGENVIDKIATNVENGELKISNENTCNFVRSYKKKIKVFVRAPKFKEIMHKGIGDIYTIGVLNTDTITYRIFNSGNLYLTVDNQYLVGGINGMGDFYGSGKTIKHLCNANGEGWVDCRNLQTDNSDFYLKISGLTFINVSQALNVVIKHSGDVYYKGNPATLQKQIDGTGKLIQGY